MFHYYAHTFLLSFTLATEVSVHWSISWETKGKACFPSLRIVQSDAQHCISTRLVFEQRDWYQGGKWWISLWSNTLMAMNRLMIKKARHQHLPLCAIMQFKQRRTALLYVLYGIDCTAHLLQCYLVWETTVKSENLYWKTFSSGTDAYQWTFTCEERDHL